MLLFTDVPANSNDAIGIEDENRKYQQTIWLVIGDITGLMLLSLIFHHIQEVYMFFNVNSMEAEY